MYIYLYVYIYISCGSFHEGMVDVLNLTKNHILGVHGTHVSGLVAMSMVESEMQSYPKGCKYTRFEQPHKHSQISSIPLEIQKEHTSLSSLDLDG